MNQHRRQIKDTNTSEDEGRNVLKRHRETCRELSDKNVWIENRAHGRKEKAHVSAVRCLYKTVIL
jgi:hypothetical protein